MAQKLYKIFGKGNVTLIADGLYACGPVIKRCREYQWEYMITLKEDAIPEVWKEATGLMSRSTRLIEEKKTRYAWISSKPLTKKNVFMRCAKMARYRWKIENNFLFEKHEGYFFEHVYSYDWQAMKGFHYLMKAGHFLNAMAINSEILLEYVNEMGIQGFINDLWLDLSGAVLDTKRIGDIVAKKYIWKLKTA